MSRFLKLTNHVLNTRDIHKIVIHPNKYLIHFVSKKITGYCFAFLGNGIGNISSHTWEIEVCKTNHSTDYEKVTKWIENEP